MVPQKYSFEDKFSGDVVHVSGRMESIPEEDRYISRFLNFSLKPTTPRRLKIESTSNLRFSLLEIKRTNQVDVLAGIEG